MSSHQTESPVSPAATTRDTATPLSVDVRRFPWVRRLAADYTHNFAPLASFFAGDPATDSAWGEAIRRTTAHPRDREAVAGIVEAQHERRGAPPRAREAARSLRNTRAVAVVTGQQAGLFGGPLFTLLKALTAIRLAEQVGRAHNVPAVAIFWVDAEDHDWNEVRACTVFDNDLNPASIALPARSGDPVPVGRVALDESVRTALDELERVLPATEFRASVLDALRAAYAPGRGMAEAFARWLEHVLGDRGLIVYDASDPASKPLVREVFTREIAAPGETGRLAAETGARLTAAGYHTQVQSNDEGLALFHLGSGRRPIRRVDGGFLIDEERLDQAALVARASSTPSIFSPNVLLRPVVQDAIFPTVCYVAGPNELAYLAQLGPVYRHFGVPMPLMYSRLTATLVDSAALRFLHKYKVPFEALQPQDESGLNQLLASQIPPEVDASFTQAATAIETQMTRLMNALPAIDPTLEGAARTTLGKMQHDLMTLRAKMIQAAKRRDDTLRRQYMRTRALTFPGGHGQERTIGFVSFLNQYGPALIDRLVADVPLDSGHHWVAAI